MKNRSIIFLFVLALFLCACSAEALPTPPLQDPADGQARILDFDPRPPAQLKPGDALHLAGNSSAQSESFVLSESTLLRLHWEQTEGKDFVVSIQPVQLVEDRVQFALQQGPGEGSGDWIFKAGAYIVVVEGEGSQWNITIEVVEFRDNPFDLLDEGK